MKETNAGKSFMGGGGPAVQYGGWNFGRLGTVDPEGCCCGQYLAYGGREILVTGIVGRQWSEALHGE